MEYEKIPLGVEARFFTDGTIFPRTLTVEAQKFTIDRIIRKRLYNPGTVNCIAPIEYTVMVDGLMKQIYYEPETCQWFSIKQRK